MVTPILLFAAALAGAFLLPIVRRVGSTVTELLVYGILAFLVFVPASHLPALLAGGEAVEIVTGGGMPPLSINLRLGLSEAVILSLVNLVAIGSLLRLSEVLRPKLREGEIGGYALFLLMVMGANGIVMTRDVFNIFVFLEIMSIATYGLLVVGKRSLQAAFKYIVAGGLASAFFLLGVIFLYRQTGTLNLDGMIEAAAGGAGSAILFAGVFLLLVSVLIELKPFPANGWALDVYQAAHPGVAASVSAATASAVVVVLYKVSPLLDAPLLSAVAWIGVLTFFASNLIGLTQSNERRMLGYSSVAQIGLVAFVIAQAGLGAWGQEAVYLVAGGLLVNHLLAKAGLFWSTRTDAETAPRALSPADIVPIAILVLALIGLPPSPAFWAKWSLVHRLVAAGDVVPVILILAGSLFEALYLLRWLGRRAGASGGASAGESGEDRGQVAADGRQSVGAPVFVAAALILAAGGYTGLTLGFDGIVFWLPLAAIVGLSLLDVLPLRINAGIGIAAIAWFAYRIYPSVSGLPLLFSALFAAGGVLVLIGVLHRTGRMPGFVPMVVGATGSLIGVAVAQTGLEFFFAWEILTLTTYLLVLRSKRDGAAALRYAGFSLGGALAILAGLAVLSSATGAAAGIAGVRLGAPLVASAGTGLAFVLLALGALSKAGAVGLHLWLPDTYAATDDEGTAFFSAVVSKAAVLALLVFASLLVSAGVFGGDATAGGARGADLGAAILGWVGVATALFGALLAVFQEDAKYLLAYSSMSQVGYMILGVSIMSHLGWVSGVYLTVLHAIFKAMLFLALAGVIKRAGTSVMYRLGGLIKRMPITFVSVLMGIIAVSGVPPLAGFGGKWLLYTALIEKGWFLQAGLTFFAGAMAFLYLFRLIHTIFLGQLKDEHRTIKEAPAALLVPQVILIIGLFAVSLFPSLLVNPAIAAVEPFFATTVEWQDYTVISSLGYWNGSLVMLVTMGVFALPLIWLIVVMRRPQHVEQFNIVYAAERPERPETTHFAHNFFAPYRKALGFAMTPLIRRFWAGLSAGVVASGSALRRIYTGNGQTYALHIVIFVVVLFLAVGGLR